MKYVEFGMYWQESGQQRIPIPDSIDSTDKLAIIEYIKSVWNTVPIPEGTYIGDSDKLDEESEFVIYDDEKEEL